MQLVPFALTFVHDNDHILSLEYPIYGAALACYFLNMNYKHLHHKPGSDECVIRFVQSSPYNNGNSKEKIIINTKRLLMYYSLTVISLFGFQYDGATLSAAQDFIIFVGCALTLATVSLK